MALRDERRAADWGEGQLDKALNCVTNGLNLLNLGLEWRIAAFETSVD